MSFTFGTARMVCNYRLRGWGCLRPRGSSFSQTRSGALRLIHAPPAILAADGRSIGCERMRLSPGRRGDASAAGCARTLAVPVSRYAHRHVSHRGRDD